MKFKIDLKFKIKNLKFKKGFTLLELLIYSGILVVSAGLVSGIVYTVSRANIKTQVNDALSNQLIRFEEVFRQKIQIAKGINSISGSLLSLEMTAVNKNPTIFTLTDNTVYIQEGSGSQVALNDSDTVKVTSLSFVSTGAESTSISNTYHYAWSGNVGWIDFAYSGGNVEVPAGQGDLSGLAYVLSDSHWISLNCFSTESCATVDYKVSSDANGNLSGWAWSENFGWISFNCLTDNTCAFTDYKVTVNQDTGEFDGYAYSENIGWISFNCKTGGVGQTNICAISDYKVQDLRTRTSAIKADITLQYNSEKPELSATSTNSFVFNIITPTK
ncbi:type II secretion system protein [bacterium]|nr:MAG: type II secretion system protein [bacterium]